MCIKIKIYDNKELLFNRKKISEKILLSLAGLSDVYWYDCINLHDTYFFNYLINAYIIYQV